MTSVDIICGILLLYGVWRGWSKGVIVQLSGIIGLLLGGYLAWHYSEPVGRWIGAEDMLGQVAGFLIIFIVIVVLLAILGRMFRGMFRFAGLGIFDHLGGLLLGGIKVALLLYVLINTYESANQVRHWTSNKGIEQSFLYKPIKEVGELAFPYLQELRDQVSVLDAEPFSVSRMTKYRNEIRREGEQLEFVFELGKKVSFTRSKVVFSLSRPSVWMEIVQ